MKEFDTSAFKMIIYDNLLKEIRVKKNIKYSEKDVWKSRDLSLEYKPGAKFFVLFEGEDGSTVSAAARSAAASDDYFKHVAALALYSDKTLESIMGNLFLKINKPKVPTRFFDKRDRALAWLTQQMKL
jgi:hypothetical protein